MRRRLNVLGGAANFNNVTVDQDGTLAIRVGGSGDWNYSENTDISTLLQETTFDSGSILGIDTSDGSLYYAGPITANSTADLDLVVSGDNTLTLAGSSNAFAGTIEVMGGATLDAATPDALGGDGNFSNITVDKGAALAVMVATGANNDWNYVATTDDIGNLLDNATFEGGASLDIDMTDATGGFIYAGAIADSAQGPLGLTILGGGSNGETVTLSGYNSYSGPTTVIAGTLEAGQPDALSSASVVDLTGGSLNLCGYGQAIAGLSGGDPTGGIGLTLGSADLTVDTSSPETYSGKISGGSDSQIIVSGNGTQGFTGVGSLGNYSGSFEVTAGAILDAGSPAALGDTTTFTNVTVDDQGTLAVMVGDGSDWQTGNITNLLTTTGGAAFADGASLGFDTSDDNFSYGGIADTMRHGVPGTGRAGRQHPHVDRNQYLQRPHEGPFRHACPAIAGYAAELQRPRRDFGGGRRRAGGVGRRQRRLDVFAQRHRHTARQRQLRLGGVAGVRHCLGRRLHLRPGRGHGQRRRPWLSLCSAEER